MYLTFSVKSSYKNRKHILMLTLKTQNYEIIFTKDQLLLFVQKKKRSHVKNVNLFILICSTVNLTDASGPQNRSEDKKRKNIWVAKHAINLILIIRFSDICSR